MTSLRKVAGLMLAIVLGSQGRSDGLEERAKVKVVRRARAAVIVVVCMQHDCSWA